MSSITKNSMFSLRNPFEWGNMKGKAITPKGSKVELQLLNFAFGTSNKYSYQSGLIFDK